MRSPSRLVRTALGVNSSGFSPEKDIAKLSKQIQKLEEELQRERAMPKGSEQLLAAKVKLEIIEPEYLELKQQHKKQSGQYQDLVIEAIGLRKDKEALQTQVNELKAQIATLKDAAKDAAKGGTEDLVRTTIDQWEQRRRGSQAASKFSFLPQRDAQSRGQPGGHHTSTAEPPAKVRNLITDFFEMTHYWCDARLGAALLFSHLIGGIGDALQKIRVYTASADMSSQYAPKYALFKKFLDHFEERTNPPKGDPILPTLSHTDSISMQARLTSMVKGLIEEDPDFTPAKIDTELRRLAALPSDQSSVPLRKYYAGLIQLLSPLDHKALDLRPRDTNLRLLSLNQLDAQSRKTSRLWNISKDGVIGGTFFPPESFREFNKLTAKLHAFALDIDVQIKVLKSGPKPK